MSIKEANRLSVMQQLDKRNLSIRNASKEIGVCLRQTKRIRKRYLLEGGCSLISKYWGKISSNRIDAE